LSALVTMSLTPSTPGQMGFLVLNSDTGAVLTSGGDMQSDEKTASSLYALLKTCSQLAMAKQISISYSDHTYTVVLNGDKIHVVKRETGVDPVV